MHESAVLDAFCAGLGGNPKVISRTARALTVLDELIVPESFCGRGDDRRKAKDVVLVVVS